MDRDSKNSFNNLRQHFTDGNYFSLLELQEKPHVLAVVANAFKDKIIDPEPIYSLNGIIAHELLSRPKSQIGYLEDNIPSISTITEGFYADGHWLEIDTVLCRNALESAPKYTPFTLNISVESAKSPEFFKELEEPLSPFYPQNVIWEVLEHEIDSGANLDHLSGLELWIDDLKTAHPDTGRLFDPEHQSRIDVFLERGLATTAKFDGKMIRARFGDQEALAEHTKDCLAKAVDYLKTNFPNVNLVAEHVQNREEANILFDMGFEGVQGSNLKPEDFHYTNEARTKIKLSENTPLHD